MAKKIKNYTDIGHSGAGDDLLWILHKSRIEIISDTEEGRTHEQVWGQAVSGDSWRGRYEAETGLCSVVAPIGHKKYYRPPMDVLLLLNRHFTISRFYFFAGGTHESFTPNPKR